MKQTIEQLLDLALTRKKHWVNVILNFMEIIDMKKVKLKKGCGSKVRSENIRKLIHKEGLSQYESVGIAIDLQKTCKPKKKK